MKSFRRAFASLALIGALAFACLPASAQSTYGSTVGNANGTTSTAAVIPTGNGGVPVVEYLSATSDVASAAVQFYTAADPVLVTGASTANTTNVVAVGSGNFTANDKVAIRFVGADQYQVTTVYAVTATNITTLNALSRALTVGDAVYKLTESGKIPVGVGTVSVSGPSWAGQASKPLVLILTANTNGAINAVTYSHRR